MLKKFIMLFILSCSGISAEEINLSRFEKSIYSHNGEDGVLAKLNQLLKSETRTCVELGAGDGTKGSCAYLLRKQGWECLLLDRAYEEPGIHLYKEFLTAENINAIFEKYNVPEDLNILIIDLGFNDFYIWKALHQRYKPNLVLIHYNSSLGTEDKVVTYRPFFCGDGTDYFGASIQALHHLGKARGYSLIYAEHSGNTLFFLRDEIMEAKNLSFKNCNDVEKLFLSIRSRKEGDFREDPKKRPYLTSASLINKK